MSRHAALLSRATLAVVIVSAAALLGSNAHAGTAVTEPEYVGICYKLNAGAKKAEDALKQLERQTLTLRTKTKGLGFGGTRAGYEVPGPASPVRFTEGETLKFVIRLASKDVDPASAIRLVPFEAVAPGKKEAKNGGAATRQSILYDQKGAFSQGTLDPTLGALPLLIKPYGESSLEMKAETDLAPGEYAFVMPSSMTAFCFGVDAKAAAAPKEPAETKPAEPPKAAKPATK